MLNQKFMSALAQLESVSCSQQERDTINAVRGKYVAKFGNENRFVRTLAQLESVAATQAERDEINTIRGKFGLMEMTNYPVDITDTESERKIELDPRVVKNNLATTDDQPTGEMDWSDAVEEDSVRGMLGDPEEETPWY